MFAVVASNAKETTQTNGLLDLKIDFAKWYDVPLVSGVRLFFFFHLVLSIIIIISTTF